MPTPKKGKEVLKNQAIQEIYKCSRNPIYFIDNYCKIQHPKRGLIQFKTYEYQKEAVANFLAYDKNIINKARQLGFSTLLAAFITWLVLFHKDKSVLVVSTKSEVAKNLIKKVKTMLKHLPNWMYLADITTNQAHQVGFSNGSWVKSIARGEDAGRSEGVSLLVVDEAAHIRDMEELWKGLASVTAAGGKTIALSCVTDDTFIFTDKGIKQVKDFIPNERKVGDYQVDEYSIRGNNKLRTSNLFHNNGKVKTKKLTTKLSELECSENHKLWACKNGKYDWYRSDQLEIGDWVNVQYGMNCWGDNDDISDFDPLINSNHKNIFKCKRINSDLAYLFGLFLAEGNFSEKYKYIDFTCGDDLTKSLSEFKFKILKYDDVHYRISSNSLVQFWKYLGFDEKQKAHQKEIPSRLMEMSKDNISSMLSGLFDGDGSSHGKRGTVSICLSSEKMIDQIRMLLLNFGIRSMKQKRTVEQLNENLPEKWYSFKHDSFRLELNEYNSKLFYDLIEFRFDRKQINKEIIENKKFKNTHDVIPNSLDLVRTMFEYYSKGCWSLEKYHGIQLNNIVNKQKEYKTQNISKDVVSKMFEISKEYLPDYLVDKIENEILLNNSEWVQIKEIQDGENETFDFSLPETDDFWCHSVLYSGLLGHQTPKGVGNWFYKFCREAISGESQWHYQEVFWWSNPEYAEGLRDDPGVPGGKRSPWFDNQTEGWTKQQIAQELLTSFTETGDTFLDAAVIEYYEKASQEPLEKIGNDHCLWVWKNSEDTKKYLICCDVASGTAEDFSTAHVIDVMELDQVAEYKGKMPPDVFAEFLIDVLGPMYNNAHIVVENNGLGMVTAFALKNSDYKNVLYITEDNKMIDKWQAEYEGISPGFKTTLKTRPIILQKTEELLRKREVNIRSKRLVNEFLNFIWKNGKAQARKGETDDLVMALAIGLWIRELFFRYEATSTKSMLAMYDAMLTNKKKADESGLTDGRSTQLSKEKHRIKKIVENQKSLRLGSRVINIDWIHKL